MNIFVTGASGWIASALIPELIGAGHSVSGLARSDASAAAVERLGAQVVRGSLTDLDVLRAAAGEADGVVHLAFPHENMNDLAAAATTERVGLAAITEALAGTGKPIVAASGTPVIPGRPSTEEDNTPGGPMAARGANADLLLASAANGVRPSVVRLPRSVHGEGDKHGFVARLSSMFRDAGTAMYVGEGTNRWCAVHVDDAAHLFRLALDQAPAGAVLHAVGDEGIPVRTLAEALAARLGLPVQSVDAERLGFFGMMQTVDHATTATLTRALLGWAPTHPGLLDDIAAGHYDG
jgi:nucleoside-diphosphate-sugar epimerase